VCRSMSLQASELTPSRLDTILRVAAHERAFGRGPLIDEYASWLALKHETARSRLHSLVRLRLARGTHTELSQRCGGSQNTTEYRLTELGWDVIGGGHADQ
jgi:hypothetical protein